MTDSEYLRILTLKDLIFAGLSLTIGVGIFVILGDTARKAEGYTWMSFALAGLVVLFTGFSYAELSGIFKTNAT